MPVVFTNNFSVLLKIRVNRQKLSPNYNPSPTPNIRLSA
jgi:hypothetical protein